MKAIILAGGKGSRLKPLTDNIPKALIPIKNHTLIEEVIFNLPEEIDSVIITTKYLGEKIQQKIGKNINQKNIYYVQQPKNQNGTWSAFYSAKNLIKDDELFLVLNCDDLFNKTEISLLIKSNIPSMGVTETIMPAKYHGVKINEHGFVEGFQKHINEDREELIQDLFANGVFLLNKKVFSFDPIRLIDGELGLPQTLLNQKDLYPIKAFKLNNWLPCNSFEDLEKINQII